MSKDNRKATDILLDIELRVEKLEKLISNTDNLLKILLNLLNKSELKQSRNIVNSNENAFISKDNFENRTKTSKFSELANSVGVSVEDSVQNNSEEIKDKFVAKNSQLPPDPNGEDMIEAPHRDRTRGQRGKKRGNKKSSVSQILTRKADDRPLYLAIVEILNKDGELINQTRTNKKGRWLMSLEPGDYQVHVSKIFHGTKEKPPIDSTYNINIPPSDSPMELDPLSLGDG